MATREICPNCIIYNALREDQSGFDALNTSDNLIYNVGYAYNSCSAIPEPDPPGSELDYGLQCTVGLDCPDCIDFKPLNATTDGFDSLLTRDGYMKVGYQHGGCDSGTVIPPGGEYPYEAKIVIAKAGHLRCVFNAEAEYSINGGDFNILPTALQDAPYEILVTVGMSIDIRSTNVVTEAYFVTWGWPATGVVIGEYTLVNGQDLLVSSIAGQEYLTWLEVGNNKISDFRSFASGCIMLGSVGYLYTGHGTIFATMFANCWELLCLTEIDTRGNVDSQNMFHETRVLVRPDAEEQLLIESGALWGNDTVCNGSVPTPKVQTFHSKVPYENSWNSFITYNSNYFIVKM